MIIDVKLADNRHWLIIDCLHSDHKYFVIFIYKTDRNFVMHLYFKTKLLLIEDYD